MYEIYCCWDNSSTLISHKCFTLCILRGYFSKARWLYNVWFTGASISFIHGTNLFIREIVRLPCLLTNLYCTLNIYRLGFYLRFNLTYSIRQLPPSPVRYSQDLINLFKRSDVLLGFYVRSVYPFYEMEIFTSCFALSRFFRLLGTVPGTF